MKWIKQTFNYQEKQVTDKDEDEKEPLLAKESTETTENFKLDNAQGFKKWYLDEFREELESDCFKSLITAAN